MAYAALLPPMTYPRPPRMPPMVRPYPNHSDSNSCSYLYPRHFSSFIIPPFLDTAIDWGIWGDESANYNVATRHPQPFFLSGRVTKAQVLSELEYMLGQMEHASQTNPFDATSQNHINVANLLSTLMKAGMVTVSASTASDDARASIYDKYLQSKATAVQNVGHGHSGSWFISDEVSFRAQGTDRIGNANVFIGLVV